MGKYESKLITNKELWEKFLLSVSPKSFLQSWYWGEVNEKNGSQIFRLGFWKNGKLAGICLFIKEKAKRGPHLVVPAGPIIDWKDKKLTSAFLEVAKKLAIKEDCWFVRVRPEVLDTPDNRKMFARLGFIASPMHLHAENTWILDISKSEEDILAGMRKTTRYLIRKSEKFGLELEVSENPAKAKILYKLQEETIKRHKFIGFPQKLFETEISVFGKDNKGAVFICKRGKKDLAIAIIVFYADTAYYHFSGSVSGYSEIPFSYFLQWQIIKEAKRRGIKYYNFWGIAPTNDPKHRFAGVTLFKTGFGGERIDWLHAHDLVISRKYWLTYLFETARRIFRHL